MGNGHSSDLLLRQMNGLLTNYPSPLSYIKTFNILNRRKFRGIAHVRD